MKKTFVEWDDEEVKKCQLKDVFFLYIKYRPGSVLEAIAAGHTQLLEKLGIDKDGLYVLLDGLITEHKLLLSQEGNYTLHPEALYFPGFLIEYLKGARERRKRAKLEMFLKIFPYFLTIVFGVSTFYFNLLSARRYKDLQVKTREADSLRVVVTSLKTQLKDSMKLKAPARDKSQ
ncbi:MAG: hypothetical protein J0H74_22085 [Chitinophagaceae bacterium]|nr:hypothetical protein [Chitinophagaceae bacterium]